MSVPDRGSFVPDSFQNQNWYRCPEGYTKCSWDLS